MKRSSRTTPPVGHLALASLLLVAVASRLPAATYTDDFTAGIDPLHWIVELDPVFTVDDTQGDVRLARPQGGGHLLRAAHLRYRGSAEGDFDVAVTFREAMIDQVDGLPGNQVQLNLSFGGQAFSVVRSDEPAGGGDNHHVWLDPPGAWFGAQPDPATEGVMRVRRVGSLVEAYIHGALFYSGTFNDQPTDDISFSLQSNGTVDAISVVFDDFSLTADAVTAVTPARTGTGLVVFAPWPNPTTGASRLGFELPAAREVTAAVYDARGRLLRGLIHGTMTAGPHALGWDGLDRRGRPVAAGVYLYRITTGAEARTRRVVITR